MNKIALIIISAVLIVGLGAIFLIQPRDSTQKTETSSDQNVEVKDSIQYIRIKARGGYSPKVSTAKANMPTKLIVATDGTYDCSSALIIRSVGFQKSLPGTGEETIDLGTPKAGELEGICGMGMYSFSIDFK